MSRAQGRTQLTVEIRRPVVESERAHKLRRKPLVLANLLVELDVACASSAVDLKNGSDATADGEILGELDVLLEEFGEVATARGRSQTHARERSQGEHALGLKVAKLDALLRRARIFRRTVEGRSLAFAAQLAELDIEMEVDPACQRSVGLDYGLEDELEREREAKFVGSRAES